MDSLHERLARLALSAASGYGFCLAGGYAVQAHGFLDRPSEDVDLFTTSAAEEQFPDAVATVIAAYKGDGLGIDWRQHQPVTLAIGPVLHPDDAVANKVCALFSGAQARDYIDVDAVLQSGRYTSDELLALAESHDPGFDEAVFVIALRAIRRLPAAEFTPYGLTVGDVSALTARMTQWADTLRS
jgi:hypothetical protein